MNSYTNDWLHEKNLSALVATCRQLAKLHFSVPKMSDFLILNCGRWLMRTEKLTNCGLISIELHIDKKTHANFMHFSKKIIYIAIISATGLFKYVWPFCNHQALKGYRKNEIFVDFFIQFRSPLYWSWVILNTTVS